MKKIIIVVITTITIWITIKFIFSYKLICLPLMFGTNTFESGMKCDFPRCILNPIKINHIKTKIVDYATYRELNGVTNKENIILYLLKDINQICVISYKKDGNKSHFLLETNDPQYKIIVVLDQELNVIELLF